MSNEDLMALWEEISAIALADKAYIDSLPDQARLNDTYIRQYDRFLSDHFVIASV